MEQHWYVSRRVGSKPGAIVLSVLLMIVSATVRAETGPAADLSGVTTFQLTINQTTPDAMTCGIDLRQLAPVVSDALQAGGLASDPAADVTVALTVLTDHDSASGVCATTPMLGAYRRVAYFDAAVGWLRSGQVVLWQRATMAASGSADHAVSARRAVSELADALLSSWRDTGAGGLARR